MTEYGIHSIIVSFTKVFSGDEVKSKNDTPVSERLFDKVDHERVFDTQRIEIVTKGEDHFTFTGKIYESIPRFDEIISLEDFERSLKVSKAEVTFKFQAAVRLSVTYPFSEFSKFLAWADDEGLENPNLFNWIQYCIDDANEVLGEESINSKNLKPLLSIRGI